MNIPESHVSGKFEIDRVPLVVEVAAKPRLGNYGFMVGQTAI
jgi:hypothetical protein